MTHALKIQYTRIALSLVGITADDMTCETIMITLEELKVKGGDFSVREAAKIASKIREKYKRKSKTSSKSE